MSNRHGRGANVKYNIEGFSQQQLIEHGLDIVDAEILRWFVDFQATGKMKYRDVDGERYHWIYYPAVIKELPILGIITPNGIAKRLRKMQTGGLLKLHIQRLGKGKGTVTWWRTTDLLSDLIQTPEPHEKEQTPTPQNDTDARKDVSNTSDTDARKDESDSSSRDSSTKGGRPDSYNLLVLEDRAPPEHERPIGWTAPAPGQPASGMSRDEFRARIYKALLDNNPAAPTPADNEYAAAERIAKGSGGSEKYLEWLRKTAAKQPGARLFELHEEYLPELFSLTKPELPKHGRCPHGHADPEQCRKCFFEKNEHLDDPLADLQRALRKDDTPKARADRERDKLKAV
jgi:hypothetical protein